MWYLQRSCEDYRTSFMSCNGISSIWYACFKWLNVSNMVHDNVNEHFLLLESLVERKGESIDGCLWICVIWNWRNKLIFGGRICNVEKIVEEIKGRLWSWCSSFFFLEITNFTYTEWLEKSRKMLDC